VSKLMTDTIHLPDLTRRRGKRLSPQTIALARTMRKRGKTYHRIAESLGICYSTAFRHTYDVKGKRARAKKGEGMQKGKTHTGLWVRKEDHLFLKERALAEGTTLSNALASLIERDKAREEELRQAHNEIEELHEKLRALRSINTALATEVRVRPQPKRRGVLSRLFG